MSGVTLHCLRCAGGAPGRRENLELRRQPFRACERPGRGRVGGTPLDLTSGKLLIPGLRFASYRSLNRWASCGGSGALIPSAGPEGRILFARLVPSLRAGASTLVALRATRFAQRLRPGSFFSQLLRESTSCPDPQRIPARGTTATLKMLSAAMRLRRAGNGRNG